jgi:hypothetical protein
MKLMTQIYLYNTKYPFFEESYLYFRMHLLVSCITKFLQNSCNDYT